MSGICALVSFDGSSIAAEDLDGMIGAAPHRAVMGAAKWQRGRAALGHLSTPATSEDDLDDGVLARGGLALVADARIDNRAELVPELVRRGFLAGDASNPDSEIILAAHRCWGDEAPARLVGDFAYVLWDERRSRLLAARDPMGMRPLYHRVEPGRRALIASELKQILTVPGVPCEIDEGGLAATIAGPYLPADATVYLGIAQLAPGRLLIAEAGRVLTRRYWRPDPGLRLDLDARESVDAFRERFRRAVADRLREGRPVGLFLSGGIDSGSIASMAGWLHRRGRVPGPVATYSWAFREVAGSDERAVSDLIVEHYGMPAAVIEGDDAWPLAGYPDHAPDRDDPFIWVYQGLIERTVAHAAADGIGILLSGDRGDELLGDWVFDELGLLRSRKLGAAISDLRVDARRSGVPMGTSLRRNLLRPLIGGIAPGALAKWTGRGNRRVRTWPSWVPDDLARRVDLGDRIAEAQRLPSFDGYARSVRFQRIFNAQAARTAVLQERTRARLGIGFSDPFADRRLIELVLALPQWRVQRRGDPKAIARAAMRGVMPEAARQRASKTIPSALFDRGFRDRAVGTVRSLLNDSRAAANGWIDQRAARRAYENYVATGNSDHDFWWPIVVEWWLRRWWP